MSAARAGARRGPPRRIALLSDWWLPRRGGIELHLADLAVRLAAAGHRVDVLTTTPAAPDDAPDDAPGAARDQAPHDASGDRALAAAGVRVRRLAVPRLPGAGVACTPALLRALDAALAPGSAGRYDVAHCHASVVAPVAWAGAWAARRHGVPSVVTFHSVLHRSVRALALTDRLAGWSRWPLVATGVSTVVTDQLRRSAPAARVAVLPNATDVRWWADGVAAAPGDLPTGVPPRAPGELRLVTAMRLVRKKRPDALVRALRAAVDHAPAGTPVRLVVAGDGPARAALVAEARRAGLGEALVLAGWLTRPALRALHHGADLFVFPSPDESFGLAALEACAAGLPVLGRAGNGLADFVRPDAGVLAADEHAFAAAAGALVHDAARLTALAAAARAHPPCAFDWSAVVARHERIYSEAAAAAPRATVDDAPRRAQDHRVTVDA